MEVVTIITGITASVISGMVLFYLKRYFDKKDKRDDQKYKLESERNILILKCINAIGKLTQANAIAVRDGKSNGEIHQALKEYGKMDKELLGFLLKNNSMK